MLRKAAVLRPPPSPTPPSPTPRPPPPPPPPPPTTTLPPPPPPPPHVVLLCTIRWRYSMGLRGVRACVCVRACVRASVCACIILTRRQKICWTVIKWCYCAGPIQWFDSAIQWSVMPRPTKQKMGSGHQCSFHTAVKWSILTVLLIAGVLYSFNNVSWSNIARTSSIGDQKVNDTSGMRRFFKCVHEIMERSTTTDSQLCPLVPPHQSKRAGLNTPATSSMSTR